jgi:subtilisin family serine protease
MTTESDDNSRQDGHPVGDRRPWWDDLDLQRSRFRTQIQLIVDKLPGVGVDTGGSDDLADMQYMYRQNVILVRDADVERVRQVLGGPPRSDTADDFVTDGLIAGITALGVDDTPAALETVDSRLGVGVATPDHVFYVTPACCCPATEPDIPGQNTPWPAVTTDEDCDGTGVLAVVVDTGFLPSLGNPEHPWLSGVTGDAEIYDPAHITRYTGHGTFVAGVLRCMAPGADVVVKGFLTEGGAIYEQQIIKELYKALDLVPDIVSMSAGTTTRHNLPPLGFQVLWEQRLRDLKGTVLVAAAGNDGDRGPFWPATFPWAVAVGALDDNGNRAPYSNYGSWVDVYALGSDVVNAFPNGEYYYEEPPRVGEVALFEQEMARWSGTSFATPLVSGLIAARISRTGESGRRAARALLRLARRHATPGVGPILEPGMACLD